MNSKLGIVDKFKKIVLYLKELKFSGRVDITITLIMNQGGVRSDRMKIQSSEPITFGPEFEFKDT